MRLIIIGRLIDEHGKTVAYKLYDADAKETGIYSKKMVDKQVKKRKGEKGELVDGIPVVGLKATNYDTVETVHCSFNISKTDRLNGAGERIEPSGRYILLGFSGFLENTKYRVVDSMGIERILTMEEFNKLVDEDKINGAQKSTRIENKIVFYGPCYHSENGY